LNDKKNYVCHITNLQYYLKKGIKLTKIHRVIEFTHEAFLKSYIDNNTKNRKSAKNEFEKDFWKLANNSVYGKTLENVRNHKKIDLVYDYPKAQKIINSKFFKDYREIGDVQLTLFERYKEKVILNKPITISASVLDVSKYLMYMFWYDHLKVLYGDKVKLIYTDTDSLIFEVETDDYYEDILKHKDFYDLSEYDKNFKCYDEKNKKIIGKFKDECAKTFIREVIAIRSKVYCVQTEDEYLKKKIKGIKKGCVEDEINFDDYDNCLFNDEIKDVTMNLIRSENHQIYSQSINKFALCPINDKRYLNDFINSYADGHYKISKN